MRDSELYARAAVLLDGNSGRVLYGKAEEERLPMASTTKIMTCIVALEHDALSMECEVSKRAAAAPKVKLGAPAGRHFSVEDLLYTLMLESHNDAAVMVAEAVAGSVEGFAVLMNRKAEELGLQDTSFVTPNGLDADGHYTTARDLARLLRYCVAQSPKREEFLEITRRQSYTFSDLEGIDTYTAVNHNAFLTMMSGALSGKTGFTGKAGYCYVGALERDGKLLIVALLACGWPGNRSYKWHDTRLLMEYGLDQYELTERELLPGLPASLPVEGGVYDWASGETASTVALEADYPARISYLMREDETLDVRVTLSDAAAPVRAGDPAGSIEIWVGEDCMEKYPVTFRESVEKIDWKWYVRQAARAFLIF